MPSKKDCPFLTKPLYGSGFRPCHREGLPPLPCGGEQGQDQGKNNHRFTQHVCGVVLRRLQPCHRHTDRCRRQKRSLRCKYTPLHMVSPISSLLVGSKGLDRGRSRGQHQKAETSFYQTRCLSPATNPLDTRRPDLHSGALSDPVHLYFSRILLDWSPAWCIF